MNAAPRMYDTTCCVGQAVAEDVDEGAAAAIARCLSPATVESTDCAFVGLDLAATAVAAAVAVVAVAVAVVAVAVAVVSTSAVVASNMDLEKSARDAAGCVGERASARSAGMETEAPAVLPVGEATL